jgi:hypothetical protein
MVDVCICNVHFVYFTTNWYILCPFGKICGHLFSRFGMLYREKSGKPASNRSTEAVAGAVELGHSKASYQFLESKKVEDFFGQFLPNQEDEDVFIRHRRMSVRRMR